MTREQKLSEYIIGRINTPLVWGVSDCCLFVADALHAMTGKDIASWFRGEYSTRGKAFEMLRKFAGGSVKETVEELARVFDQDFSNLSMVQRGLSSLRDGQVQLANYQEVRIRHFHQTLEKYLSAETFS